MSDRSLEFSFAFDSFPGASFDQPLLGSPDPRSFAEQSRETSAGWGQIERDQNEFSNLAWKPWLWTELFKKS
jgi:hypothetical protein